MKSFKSMKNNLIHNNKKFTQAKNKIIKIKNIKKIKFKKFLKANF